MENEAIFQPSRVSREIKHQLKRPATLSVELQRKEAVTS